MIRAEGIPAPLQDPKLKLPAIGSNGAIDAVSRTITTGEIAELRKALADAHAEIMVLTVRVDDQDAKIAALLASMTKVTTLPETVIALPAVTRAALPGKTPKLTAAEKQRAYRERQKAKA